MADIVERLNELSRWMIANDMDMRMSKEMIDPAVGGAEIARLRAENERLRAALAHVANTVNIAGGPYVTAQARAALGGTDDTR